MRTLIVALLAVLAALPAPASAQGQAPPDGLYISFRGTGISARGGAEYGAWNSTSATSTGTDRAGLWIVPQECGGGPGAGRAESNPWGATAGWTAEITPLEVVGDAVSFHLKWTRVGTAAVAGRSGGDYDVTLRPGQSMPLDILPTSRDPVKCEGKPGNHAILLSVTVDRLPDEDREPRLMVTDLWLVQRLPDGSERSQALSVRSLPFRPTAFYFDSVTDGGITLDFSGELVASPSSDSVEVTLTTRSRLVRAGRVDVILGLGGNRFGPREVKTGLRLRNEAVGAVELPRLSENDSGAFANHTFSIRLRTKQVR